MKNIGCAESITTGGDALLFSTPICVDTHAKNTYQLGKPGKEEREEERNRYKQTAARTAANIEQLTSKQQPRQRI